MSRREWLGGATSAAVLAPLACQALAAQPEANEDPFVYSLNTSTIRGQNLPIVDEVAIAAKAGYQAIEPWISELDQYVQKGGNLRDLGRRIQDAGLRVESAIGFCEWIVDDNAQRRKALEEARRTMDLVRQIGGRRLAAPPVGATKQTDLSLPRAAERYRCASGNRRQDRRRAPGRGVGIFLQSQPARRMRLPGH